MGRIVIGKLKKKTDCATNRDSKGNSGKLEQERQPIHAIKGSDRRQEPARERSIEDENNNQHLRTMGGNKKRRGKDYKMYWE